MSLHLGNHLKKKYANIEAGLKNFISNCNEQGVAVNTELLRIQASEIAKVSGQIDFKCSNGYFTNLQSRQSVTCSI